MAKHDLILRISKVRTTALYHFSIETNLETGPRGISLPSDGRLPDRNSEDFDDLKKRLQYTLGIIFRKAGEILNTGNSINYKLVFSDRKEAEGSVAPSDQPSGRRFETYRELTLPMDETECALVYDCIPNHW